MKVLLPIKPKYVAKILDGSKRFEFRKYPFAREVERVVIYASSPIKKVVGEFRLLGCVVGDKDIVWNQCKDAAGINKTQYDEYYSNQKNACALKIGEVVQYAVPLDLKETYGIKPPQSYCYLRD